MVTVLRRADASLQDDTVFNVAPERQRTALCASCFVYSKKHYQCATFQLPLRNGQYSGYNGRETMKRRALIKHIESCGARLLREGTRHTIYARGIFKSAIPRHTEIVDELARKICKDLKYLFCS
jgi:mRNA interferase HicA